jgi:uncharacterized protein YjbI with pentapeptide repeats
MTKEPKGDAMREGLHHQANAFALAAAVFVAVSFGTACGAAAQRQPSAACNLQTKNFSNQILNWCNFSGRDLTGADFSGATLTGVVFIHATLSGAHFNNATFADSRNPVLPSDFTLADLTGAVFQGAKFQGPTYFTYATLTGADFSNTDLRTNAIFGESPLTFDRNGPRTAFHGTTMNCEFIDDWKSMDLRNAVVTPCLAQLAGRNFSGIWLGCVTPGSQTTCVNLSGADLAGTNFSNGDLTGVDLTGAYLAKANFFQTKLYGAHFNNANLACATLKNAGLSNGNGATANAATFTGAYLKNVNLSGADLRAASLNSVNFYGSISTPAGSTCVEDPNNPNFTLSCASASGAALLNTSFNGAYLYGVDFGASTTKLQQTSFYQAVLVGANMEGATFTPVSGKDADFNEAFIQGATFPDKLTGTNFQGACVDFKPNGNTLTIRLNNSHTMFARYWGAQQEGVCVAASYGGPTAVPGRNVTLICPDGTAAKDNAPPGCGVTTGAPPHWRSCVDIAQNTPPASYQTDPTYGNKAPPICPPDPRWSADCR